MDDDNDLLSNVCTDLVSLRRLEPGLVHLFREKPAGAWTSIGELYTHAGEATIPNAATLSVAWLHSPSDPDYAVIVFLDDETKWSFTADYNATRLLGRRMQPEVAAAG